MKTVSLSIGAAELAALAEVRRRPAYCLARAWLDRVLASDDMPFTKGLHVSVQSVVILFKASFVGAGNAKRPTIAAALADPDADVSVALALSDSGAAVDSRRDSCTGEKVLGCNVKERLLWGMFRSRARTGSMGPSIFDALPTLQ